MLIGPLNHLTSNDELTTTDNTSKDRSQLTLSQISAQRRGRDMGARQGKWSANSVIGTFLLFFFSGLWSTFLIVVFLKLVPEVVS